MVAVACLCPSLGAGEARHPDGDTITLKTKLDFRTAVAMQKTVSLLVGENEDATPADILAVLTESYVTYGVESWTLVGLDEKPIPVTQATVAEYLLTDIEAAMAVSDEADELYAPVVLRPLLERGLRRSQGTPTIGSTSAETSPSLEPPMPSRPSLISTSPTVSTEKTSSEPAGDSSSSPSLASVG